MSQDVDDGHVSKTFAKVVMWMGPLIVEIRMPHSVFALKLH